MKSAMLFGLFLVMLVLTAGAMPAGDIAQVELVTAAALPVGDMVVLGQTAPAQQASAPENDVITAVPPNAFNPDAGLGMAKGANACKNGYSTYKIENESATPVYVCFRRGTTKANYTQVCAKRCNGCMGGGIEPAGPIADAMNQVFLIAGVATDAGVQVSLQCAR